MSDENMEKIIHDEWKKAINKEFTKKEHQADFRKGVIEGATEYHDLVKRQEDNPDIVDKRMLTESPVLNDKKLRYDGANILPDFDALERGGKKKWLTKKD